MRFHGSMIIASALIAVAAQATAAGTYSVKTNAAVYLYNPNTNYTIASIPVPAGQWLVQGLSPAVDFNGSDIIRCWLLVDGVAVDQSGAMVGGGSGMPAAFPIANLAVVTTPYPQTIQLACSHDASVSGERIDPGAWLAITRAPKK